MFLHLSVSHSVHRGEGVCVDPLDADPWGWADAPGCRPLLDADPPRVGQTQLDADTNRGWAYPTGLGRSPLDADLPGLGRPPWMQIPPDVDPSWMQTPRGWADPPNMVNKQAVCILLECILVIFAFMSCIYV